MTNFHHKNQQKIQIKGKDSTRNKTEQHAKTILPINLAFARCLNSGEHPKRLEKKSTRMHQKTERLHKWGAQRSLNRIKYRSKTYHGNR